MPTHKDRPKKNTPTVATTEPDINVTPEVGNPRTSIDTIPEGAPATAARVDIDDAPDGEDGEPLDAYAAKVEAERKALRDFLRGEPGAYQLLSKADQALTNAFVERVCEVEAKMVDPILAAKDATIAEQSARIAELTADYERAIDDAGHDITRIEERYIRRGFQLNDIRDSILVTALESRPVVDPAPPRPVATWMGDVLLTPGGKVLGRVNVSRGTFGHMQAAPIYYPSEGEERLGPTGTIEAAREWVSDFARKIGWVVA